MNEQRPKGMSSGAKIAIGCGVAAVVVIVVGVGALIFLGKKVADWAQAQEVHMKNIRLEEGTPAGDAIAAARQVPYTPPPDGVVAEDRLLAYLDVRRRIGEAWKTHGGFWAKTQGGGAQENPELGDIVGMFENWSTVVTGYAEAVRDAGMNPQEFRDITEVVYGIPDNPGQRAPKPTPSEANAPTFARHREAIDELAFGGLDFLLFVQRPEDLQTVQIEMDDEEELEDEGEMEDEEETEDEIESETDTDSDQ